MPGPHRCVCPDCLASPCSPCGTLLPCLDSSVLDNYSSADGGVERVFKDSPLL